MDFQSGCGYRGELFLKTSAKGGLSKISGESNFETTRTVSELEDICSALKKLSETDSMPFLVGTSEMIMQTPVYNIESGTCNYEIISSRRRDLEEYVNSLIALIIQLRIKFRSIKRVICHGQVILWTCTYKNKRAAWPN